jgi:hypothetical protein
MSKKLQITFLILVGVYVVYNIVGLLIKLFPMIETIGQGVGLILLWGFIIGLVSVFIYIIILLIKKS